MPFLGDMLVPWRVIVLIVLLFWGEPCSGSFSWSLSGEIQRTHQLPKIGAKLPELHPEN